MGVSQIFYHKSLSQSVAKSRVLFAQGKNVCKANVYFVPRVDSDAIICFDKFGRFESSVIKSTAHSSALL